jgi:hypothetical protein
MRVQCQIEETTLTDEQGRTISGIVVKCSKCGHETKSFGWSQASLLNCLAQMTKECPKGEKNSYVP